MSRWAIDEPDPYQWEGGPQGDACPTCGNHQAECVCDDKADTADCAWCGQRDCSGDCPMGLAARADARRLRRRAS